MKKTYRLGTRGSSLALIQAQLVRESLYRFHPRLRDEATIEIVPIKTSGDWRPDQRESSFLDMGATKGLFTKEIEEALGEGIIDFAVHSMKDVSVWTPDGLTFAAFLERADPRDAFLSGMAPTLAELPAGARVGTSSLRRRAQILAMRPDVEVVPLRGNVDTRMKKLVAGEADATVLAVAGLKRLGSADRISSVFSVDEMLPAVAQGVLGIEARIEDIAIREWLSVVNHAATESCVMAERAALRILDGSCRTPIAIYASIRADGLIHLRALVARPDGTQVIRDEQTGPADDAAALGTALGERVRAALPHGFMDC